MRSLGISEVENFPFPTAPPHESLTRALDLLINLGAISQPQRVQSLDMASMAIGDRPSLPCPALPCPALTPRACCLTIVLMCDTELSRPQAVCLYVYLSRRRE
jgi:HrpA-like RNA helicase